MELSGLIWTAIGFLSGSIPYSVWIGRGVLGKDIRAVGDGNPGATNVFRAGGRMSGLAAVLLDGFKAAIPVGLACFVARLPSGWLFFAALAPILGHIFSPLLKGKGGKAVATLFGMWAGLTFWEMPVVLGCFMGLWVVVLDSSAWAVMFTLLGGLAHLLLWHRDPFLLAVWAGSTALMVWTHRKELGRLPRLKAFKRQDR